MESAVEQKSQTTSDKNATSPLQSQAAFRRRYRNSNLERLTIKKLKEKAERLNLNVISLKYCWQIIDLLERTRHNHTLDKALSSYRTYLSRPSFLDLPSEIRNKVYAYALTGENGIFSCSHYCEMSRYRYCKHNARRIGFGSTWRLAEYSNSGACFTALALLKQLNRAIRIESSSYYYSNNKFIICETYDYYRLPELYTHFFTSIEEDGLTHLRHLTIEQPLYPEIYEEHYERLMRLLEQFQQLQDLNVTIHSI